MTAKYQLATLGCKVNQYESQQLRETLESIGLRPAGDGEAADVAVVNTCAVTAGATRKSRQAIRRVSRNGTTPVVVVGCGADADANRLRRISGVIAVLGHDTDVRAALRALLSTRLGAEPTDGSGHQGGPAGNRPQRSSGDRDDESIKSATTHPGNRVFSRRGANRLHPIMTTSFPLVKDDGKLAARIESFAGHQRAFLKVQDGCDAHCTYCVIPQLRPRLRSKPIEVAVTEARDLVRAGHKEIIVTGIFLGAYGRETAIRKKWARRESPLAGLVDALAQVEGLRRLRLSSLEPGDVDETLLEVLASHENCVPHLHLPLQSGSPNILRSMNRQYSRDAFVAMVDRVRAVLDRPAITTDIMVGFPGESENDFQASIELARYAEFCKIHAFPFSPRANTAAARRQKDFVAPAAVRERMQRLGEVERACAVSFRSRFIGQVERVIVENGATPLDEAGSRNLIRHGRADRYFTIWFEADAVRPGDLVSCRIDRVTPERTHGTHLALGSATEE